MQDIKNEPINVTGFYYEREIKDSIYSKLVYFFMRYTKVHASSLTRLNET